MVLVAIPATEVAVERRIDVQKQERVVVVDLVNTFSESVDFIKIVRHNRTGLLKLLLQFGRYGCDIAVSDFCEAVGRRLYGNERVGESVEYQPRLLAEADIGVVAAQLHSLKAIVFDSDSTPYCHTPKLRHYFYFTKFYLRKFQKKFLK